MKTEKAKITIIRKFINGLAMTIQNFIIFIFHPLTFIYPSIIFNCNPNEKQHNNGKRKSF